MNDSASSRWTDPADLPPPTVYDPGDDPAAPFADANPPTVVLLLVEEADRRWAARTAIALGDAWAGGGRRVVLADFHLEAPVLQEELGGHGLEGVVDLFVYGASVGRCTRSPDDHEFQFIPTGTYTPDAEELFRHPRWSKLVAGFEQSRATLVLFVPAEAADLGALGTWVDQTILLGEPRDPERIAPLVRAGTAIRGIIVPPRGDTVAAAPGVELPADVIAPAATSAARDGREEMHLPPPPPRVRHRGNRAAVLLLWVLLAVAVLIAVGYVVASVRPDLVPGSAAGADRLPSAVATATLAARGGPRPLGEPLPYSVRVVAFGNFQSAHERLQELEERVPGVLFYVTPEDVQGITYHKVMAGAAPTAEVAREIRDLLLTSEVLDETEVAGDWALVQDAGFSLMLGDRENRGAAHAAVDSLLAKQVPAYAVAVPHSDGGLRWYLYAGAFPDSASATSLREQLLAAGLQPRLLPRFGSPATPEL